MPIFTLVLAWVIKHTIGMHTDYIWLGVIMDLILIIFIFIAYLHTLNVLAGVDVLQTITTITEIETVVR